MAGDDQRGGLRGRLVKGVAANGYGQLVTLLQQVLLVSVFIQVWGPDLYGEWLLLSAIPTYLTVTDLSFGAAGGNLMTMLVARGDRAGALRVFQSVWVFITVVSVAASAAFLLLVGALPLTQVLNLSVLSEPEAKAIAAVLLVHVAVGQQGSQLEATYRCEGHYATGTFFMNSMRLAEFVGTVVTLGAGGDPWHVALMFVLVRSAAYAAMWIDLKRRLPWLRGGWSDARWETIKPLVAPALSFSAFPIGAALSVQGLHTLIGIVASPAAVTLFATHRTLSRIVLQLSNAVSSSVWPELSRALGSGDRALARRLHQSAGRLSLWAMIPAAVAVFFIGAWLYPVWTRGEVPFQPWLFAALLVAAVPGGLWGANAIVPQSVNRHQRLALWVIVLAAGSIGVALALVPLLGPLFGPAVALILAEVVTLWFAVREATKVVGGTPGGYARSMFGAAADDEASDAPDAVPAGPVRIAISATARFHMWDLAKGLHERGCLAGLITGHPSFMLGRAEVPRRLIRSLPAFHVIYRLVNKWGFSPEYLDKVVFDWLASKNVPDCDVVICMAGMGLRTGRAAKRAGIGFIVDRPCSHIVVQDRLIREANRREGLGDVGVDPRLIEIETQEYQEADALTVPSEFALRSFIEQGVEATKVAAIPYGVDLARFTPLTQPDEGEFQVLFVGSASVRKGTPLLLRAFDRLQHPRKRLVFAGLVDRPMRRALREAQSRSPVTVLGPTPHEALPRLMGSSHVLVLPSVEDGFGMVVTEAMACGCPAVVSESAGVSMFLTTGEDGIVVEPGNEDALLEALQSLADDPVRMAAMGQAALARARRIGGWDAYCDAIVDLCIRVARQAREAGGASSRVE
jgi:glycosyltransferase involved in cell wall biosynthesis/O-antigen/teichoic acid export membrane protein